MRPSLLLILPVLAACTPPAGGGRTSCGIAAVAGPAMVLAEFNIRAIGDRNRRFLALNQQLASPVTYLT